MGKDRGLAARMCRPYLAWHKTVPLYPFQRKGVARLLRSRRLLFADDMGLGKTIQTAAALRKLVASGRVDSALVIAPATLIPNWLAEFEKWTPELVVTYGSPARRSGATRWQWLFDQSHVVVTNYEDIRDSFTEGDSLSVGALVLDEAHRLKNWESQTSRAARRISADVVWALTGTPLERDSKDFANLLAFLDRDAFTGEDALLPLAVLRSRAARFVLRREKKEVMGELPQVVHKHERLALLGAQRDAYRSALKSQGENALSDFNRLRTLCDYDPVSGASIKIERIIAILRRVRDVGEKAVVFSYLIEPLRLCEGELRTLDLHYELLLGSMDKLEREEAIRRFRDGDAVVLLASMRVAAEGLTLVEANHVVFVNRWWNPSLNQQATDRVVRIGQRRTVFVYVFTVEESIEEDLDRILESKERLFDDLVRDLRSGGGKLTESLRQSVRKRD